MQPQPPRDPTYLEQRRQALRAQFAVRPLAAEELQRQEDVHWARQDAEVLTRYRGELVVPYPRQIAAHGTDAAAVLADAARITGRPSACCHFPFGTIATSSGPSWGTN